MHPVLVSYAYPEPLHFKESQLISPSFYNETMGEFMLHYEDVVKSENPETMILEFMRSSYKAASELAEWDQERLEVIILVISLFSFQAFACNSDLKQEFGPRDVDGCSFNTDCPIGFKCLKEVGHLEGICVK